MVSRKTIEESRAFVAAAQAAGQPEPAFTKGQHVRLRKRPDVHGYVNDVLWFEATDFNPIPRWGFKTSWGSTYPEHELVPYVGQEERAAIEVRLKETEDALMVVGSDMSGLSPEDRVKVEELHERRRNLKRLLS